MKTITEQAYHSEETRVRIPFKDKFMSYKQDLSVSSSGLGHFKPRP